MIPEKEIDNFVREISIQTHQDNDKWHPLKEGALTDGTRINIVSPPITKNHLITLRKPASNMHQRFAAEHFKLSEETFNFINEQLKNSKKLYHIWRLWMW